MGEGPTTFYALAKERFAEAEKEEIRREAVLATVRKYGISVELATDAVMQDPPTYTCLSYTAGLPTHVYIYSNYTT